MLKHSTVEIIVQDLVSIPVASQCTCHMYKSRSTTMVDSMTVPPPKWSTCCSERNVPFDVYRHVSVHQYVTGENETHLKRPPPGSCRDSSETSSTWLVSRLIRNVLHLARVETHLKRPPPGSCRDSSETSSTWLVSRLI